MMKVTLLENDYPLKAGNVYEVQREIIPSYGSSIRVYNSYEGNEFHYTWKKNIRKLTFSERIKYLFTGKI